MFTNVNNQKHSFLVKTLKEFNPYLVNKFLSHATPIGSHNLFGFQELASLQPASFGLQPDKSRARLTYGHLGLNRLVSNLAHSSKANHLQILASLDDELKDALKCYRAIHSLHIVKRLSTFIRDDDLEDDKKIELICSICCTIANHLAGTERLVTETVIIQKLYEICNESDRTLAICSAKVFITIATHTGIVEELIKQNHLEEIMKVLRNHRDYPKMYEYLSIFIERYPNMAIETGFFELLCPLLEIPFENRTHILKCFGLIIQCDEGQYKADQAEVIDIVCRILKDPNNIDYVEQVILILQNCTMSTRSKWRCQERWELPYQLVEYAHNKCNSRLQIYSLQTLRNITEMPAIKHVVGKILRKKIKSICCLSDKAKELKKKLLIWLKYRNYKETIDTDVKIDPSIAIVPSDYSQQHLSNERKRPLYRVDRKGIWRNK